MSNNHSILILGVGRSGTTAIYNLVQQILEELYPGDIDYVYEPFLWDRQTFNKKFTEIGDEFNFVSSLSPDGIYFGRRIPLILNDEPYINEDAYRWLEAILKPEAGKNHYLGKIIRACGRLPLISKITPETKILFIIRNPVDVLNSSLSLFSLLGEDFHQSDYERLLESARGLSVGEDDISKKSQTVEKEYQFWHLINCAFISRAVENENILLLSYEQYIENQESVIQKICEFLGFEFKQDYVSVSKKGVGPIRGVASHLSKEEFSLLFNKLEDYRSLLETAGLSFSDDLKSSILQRYESRGFSQHISRQKQVFNSLHAKLHMQTEAQQHKKQVDKLNLLAAKADSKAADARAMENQIRAKLDESEAKVEEYCARLSAADARVSQLSEKAEDLHGKLSKTTGELHWKGEELAKTQIELDRKEKELAKTQIELKRKEEELAKQQKESKRLLRSYDEQVQKVEQLYASRSFRLGRLLTSPYRILFSRRTSNPVSSAPDNSETFLSPAEKRFLLDPSDTANVIVYAEELIDAGDMESARALLEKVARSGYREKTTAEALLCQHYDVSVEKEN